MNINCWCYLEYAPNFIDTFISHDHQTYIIQKPNRSLMKTVSNIIGRKRI